MRAHKQTQRTHALYAQHTHTQKPEALPPSDQCAITRYIVNFLQVLCVCVCESYAPSIVRARVRVFLFGDIMQPIRILCALYNVPRRSTSTPTRVYTHSHTYPRLRVPHVSLNWNDLSFPFRPAGPDTHTHTCASKHTTARARKMLAAAVRRCGGAALTQPTLIRSFMYVKSQRTQTQLMQIWDEEMANCTRAHSQSRTHADTTFVRARLSVWWWWWWCPRAFIWSLRVFHMLFNE